MIGYIILPLAKSLSLYRAIYSSRHDNGAAQVSNPGSNVILSSPQNSFSVIISDFGRLELISFSVKSPTSKIVRSMYDPSNYPFVRSAFIIIIGFFHLKPTFFIEPFFWRIQSSFNSENSQIDFNLVAAVFLNGLICQAKLVNNP